MIANLICKSSSLASDGRTASKSGLRFEPAPAPL